MAVVTVASGGLPVIDVTATAPKVGFPVTEASTGIAVTKVTAGGVAVTFVAVGGSTPVATFDGASSNVTLSNGNLTVTSAGGTGTDVGARSAATKTTGKYYFEITVTAGAGNNDAIGILKSSGVYTDGINNSFMVSRTNGVIFTNNGVFANPGLTAVANGTVLCFAIDLTARLGWVRKGSGSWNADGGANPATGTGGGTIAPTDPFSPFVRFGGPGGVNGNNMTANFGGSTYAQTVPSGFINWPAA